MSCRKIDLAPGVTAFSCSRGSRKVQCAYCKRSEAVYLCDYQLRGARAGQRCDGKLCEGCAHLVGENTHLCPPHRREHYAWQQREREADAWMAEIRTKTLPPLSKRTNERTDPDLDPEALARMFPDWDPSCTAWFGDRDGPPVSEIAGELRARDVGVAVAALSDWLGLSPGVAPAGAVSPEVETMVTYPRDQTKVEGFVNMYGCPPCPKCGSLYRFITKERFIACDDCRDCRRDGMVLCTSCSKLRAFRPECVCDVAVCGECCECTLAAARENAVITSQRKDTQGARACPMCEGHVVLVGNRAWCIKRYVDGGCGGYWTATSNDVREARAAAPLAAKVEHVRNAKQSREHGCHWPGCPKQCKPAMWGCYQHWMMLPKHLRDLIWATYGAGQEESMTPSRAYLDAADKVQVWIQQHLAALGASDEPTRRPSWEETVRTTRGKDVARGAPTIEDRPAAPRRRVEQLALAASLAEALPLVPVDRFTAPVGDVAQDLEARGEREDDIVDEEPGAAWDID